MASTESNAPVQPVQAVADHQTNVVINGAIPNQIKIDTTIPPKIELYIKHLINITTTKQRALCNNDLSSGEILHLIEAPPLAKRKGKMPSKNHKNGSPT